MEKGKVKLDMYFDTSEDYDISVPGLNNDISLVEKCWCVDNVYDHEEGFAYVTAEKNCNQCHGTGLALTDNGTAILAFIKKFGGTNGN